MKKCHPYITCELGDFSSILKLWSLTEIDAVAFGVLQVLLILHLLDNIGGTMCQTQLITNQSSLHCRVTGTNHQR